MTMQITTGFIDTDCLIEMVMEELHDLDQAERGKILREIAAGLLRIIGDEYDPEVPTAEDFDALHRSPTNGSTHSPATLDRCPG